MESSFSDHCLSLLHVGLYQLPACEQTSILLQLQNLATFRYQFSTVLQHTHFDLALQRWAKVNHQLHSHFLGQIHDHTLVVCKVAFFVL